MRLIDADALHNELSAKQKWVVRREDKHNEGYTYDQVHFAIDDAPTVDAVPVSFIQKRMDELKDIADYEFIENGGYVGSMSYQVHELEQLLKAWAERKEDGPV